MKTINLLILSDIDNGFSIGLLKGISLYKRTHGHWQIILCPYDYIPSVSLMSELENVCVIARPETVAKHRWLAQREVPVIYIDSSEKWRLDTQPWVVGMIEADNESIVQKAFDYFISRDELHYAFVGYQEYYWSHTRENIFRKQLEKVNKPLDCFILKANQKSENYKNFIEWLRAIPKPAGLLACNDDCGRYVLMVCREVGISVPEEIAVIGVDNDSLLCELSSPTLTSIALDTVETGYEAVQYLETVMALQKQSLSKKIPNYQKKTIYVLPERVVSRESTEKFIYQNCRINKAYEYIQHYGHDPLLLTDVAVHADLSPRILQSEFKKVTGKTVSQAIEEVRVRNIQIYLNETELSIKQIAKEMKFSSPSHLIHFFRQRTGQTPQQYRSQRQKDS